MSALKIEERFELDAHPDEAWAYLTRPDRIVVCLPGAELTEVVDEEYLRYRYASIQYIGNRLVEAGVPFVRPVGGHAVYLDARAFLPHIPPLHYPGQSLAAALYLHGGVRGCEIGTVMFGLKPDGGEEPPAMDLVRLAIPRRVYTQSHMDYLIEVILEVYERRAQLKGMTITWQPPTLRHFTAKFAYLG